MTWNAETPAEPVRIDAAGWVRVIRRGVPFAIWVFGMLAVHAIVRIIERPIFGIRRPVTPWITVLVCRGSLKLMGIRRRSRGPWMQEPGILVANHTSWLDIFVLNADRPLYFVSKSEVARWPGIGLLARATGTVFVRRDRREAADQTRLFEERLRMGHRLLFFPEGTSTDNLRVLPFKPTLFGALYSEALRDTAAVQPLSVVYQPPPGGDARYYGWWSDMSFVDNLVKILATRRQGRIDIIRHDPVAVSGCDNRKALARICEYKVRDGLLTEKDEPSKV